MRLQMPLRFAWRNAWYVVAVLLLMGAVGVVYRASRFVMSRFAIQQVTLSFSGWYSEKKADDIRHWFARIQESNTINTRHRTTLVHTLRTQHPLIKSVAWSSFIPGSVSCTINGVAPVFLVNSTQVAGDDGRLHSRDDFKAYNWDDHRCEQIWVSEEWVRPLAFATLYRFLQTVPSHVFTHYNFYYQGPQHIMLVARDVAGFTSPVLCVVDQQTISRLRRPAALQKLCDDLRLKHGTQWQKDDCFLFDFRFKKRIVGSVIPANQSTAMIQQVLRSATGSDL